METEARQAMSRHVASALTALVAATGLLTVAASGGAAPGQLSPTNLTLPAISGTAQVGNSLTANAGTWDGKRLQFAYQWLRCDSSGAGCSAIGGATASTVSLLSTYLGARMRVVVIATNRNGSAVATSAATAAVVSAPTASPPPPPPPSPLYLSDLSWASMTNGWGPVERDRSNGEQAQGDGHTITLNGQTFAKGLGGHGASDVRYGIGGCTRFQSSVGVDDEIGNYGSVVFQAYLDGVKAYDSGLMTGASATKDIDLDTTGKIELRLVVTNGGDNIDSDHADWASARVTCVSPDYDVAVRHVRSHRQRIDAARSEFDRLDRLVEWNDADDL
jgi:NPCBM/NEW2 domain